jgi:hypothetical protein
MRFVSRLIWPGGSGLSSPWREYIGPARAANLSRLAEVSVMLLDLRRDGRAVRSDVSSKQ